MNEDFFRNVLPLVIVAVVVALRWRRMKVPRRLNVGRLWIVPALLAVVAGLVLATMPPTALGWLAFLGGAAAGAVVGWQRGKLMHLERDAESGDLMMRQTPAALILVLGIFGLRRLVAPGNPGAAAAGGKLAPTALLLTDGLLGFAFGMVIAMRVTLYLRAREH